MEKNIYYPLDYGWYDSKEKWNHFCSSNCRFFSECSGKGGFCSSIERRDIQFENKELRNGLLQETCGVYGEYQWFQEASSEERLFLAFSGKERDNSALAA